MFKQFFTHMPDFTPRGSYSFLKAPGLPFYTFFSIAIGPPSNLLLPGNPMLCYLLLSPTKPALRKRWINSLHIYVTKPKVSSPFQRGLQIRENHPDGLSLERGSSWSSRIFATGAGKLSTQEGKGGGEAQDGEVDQISSEVSSKPDSMAP